MNVKISLEMKSVDEIRDLLGEISGSLKEIAVALNPPVAGRILFFVTDADGKTKPILGGKVFQKVDAPKTYSIKPVDAKGNAAKVDGVPQWASSDESLATVAPAEDGMSAVVTPVGPLGTFELQVKADADMGEGVKEVFGTASVDLVAGDAVEIAIGQVE
jgi:hypothetical protein